ncbi:MAG: CDP-diacylglycerol--serine O-phosphatidyltransferase [Coriobacteriia bacterium]|nr:CDP-diacylglycerol--serine O-phosphatidyltransferase [Coriobacteriia bacterium]MCL2871076.1 CDP-diacylglycerol--serine O-phosphatidyltransferase [Coriobacteriia bacterium]
MPDYWFIKRIPNLLTVLNMLLGLSAIILMIRGGIPYMEITIASLIAVGGIVDFFDGYLARKWNAVTDMGKQLDSFADLITFGVAPVCLLYFLAAYEQSLLIVLVAITYPLAGIYRLARYNLNDFKDHFMGLPITIAGILLAAYCVGHTFWSPHIPHALCIFITVVFVLSLSAAMVSRFRVKRVPASFAD